MGVLTDFVVAPRSAAQEVGQAACPCEEFDGLDAKGIDPVKLATLGAILTGTAFDPGFMSGESCLYGCGSEEGPWVFEVPPSLVARLAALQGDELVRAGEVWAATEEFSPRYDYWPAEAVHQVLNALVHLSRRAVGSNASLLMWMSL